MLGDTAIAFNPEATLIPALKVIVAAGLTVALAIAGNVLRASSLFYVEARFLPAAPAWWHEGIGIAAFVLSSAATLWLLTRWSGRERIACAA